MTFNHLFSPISINELTLPNRVIMGSMHVCLEGEENGKEKLIAFYEERAKNNVGLIITGGAAVCPEGSGGLHFMSIYKEEDVDHWLPLTEAVHNAGGRIGLQLFHAGRYAYKALTGHDVVAPSAIQSPINPDIPVALSNEQIEETIEAFASSALRAKKANFDAVEVMGSEGYLINQFTSPVTNQRTDQWGGTFENRIQFSLKVVRAIRQAVGDSFPIIFRMSGLDLIENSTTEEETEKWAVQLEKAGVDALNIGIGWHESKIPTISMKVPRNYFVPVAARIKKSVSIPVIASNRINQPTDIEKILMNGEVDLVSMARPFLADPAILTKTMEGNLDDINTCIACNQACLDHIFEMKHASCLVNPQAGRELELPINTAPTKKKVLIIGAGPGGLEAARVLALRGHNVTIADRMANIGGQLNYARNIPGKFEFNETIRYYNTALNKLGVHILLNYELQADDIHVEEADEIIVATGVVPRIPEINGISAAKSYKDILDQKCDVRDNVVIIGGGGVACDLAIYLKEKGAKNITLLQRSKSFAKGIGKTTRWATLLELKKKGVTMIGGISQYHSINEQTLTYELNNEKHSISADLFIYASGQETENSLVKMLEEKQKRVHVIGGAKLASDLDAKQAIYDGTIVARTI